MWNTGLEHWFQDVDKVGVTAGASAPEILVNQVIDCLKLLGGERLKEISGTEENIVFVLPNELR